MADRQDVQALTQAFGFTVDNRVTFALATEAAGHVTHHPPCIPECTECYPCKRCGLVHALGLHERDDGS